MQHYAAGGPVDFPKGAPCGPSWDNIGTMCQHSNHEYSPWSNLRRPMPLWRKLRLILSNNLIKLRKRQSCCGNYGQPGC
jgi:hypothetical protein